MVKLMEKYKIRLEDVQNMSKGSYKELVKKRVKNVAMTSLIEQCQSKGKTKELVYQALKPQEYLAQLYPSQAKAIMQGRSKTLNIKEHRPYMYKDLLCRRCSKEDETLQHIVNCGHEHAINSVEIMDTDDFTYEKKLMFMRIACRINDLSKR